MNNKPCTHEYLAATEFGKAVICRECGIVHLNIQNLSLRLEVADFLGLADTLTEASTKARRVAKEKSKRQAFTIVNATPRLN